MTTRGFLASPFMAHVRLVLMALESLFVLIVLLLLITR